MRGHFKKLKQFKLKKNNLTLFSHLLMQEKNKQLSKTDLLRKPYPNVFPIFKNIKYSSTSLFAKTSNYLFIYAIKNLKKKKSPSGLLLFDKTRKISFTNITNNPLFAFKNFVPAINDYRITSYHFLTNNFFSLQLFFKKNFDARGLNSFFFYREKKKATYFQKFIKFDKFSFKNSPQLEKNSNKVSFLLLKLFFFCKMTKNYRSSTNGSKFTIFEKIAYNYSYLSFSRIFFYDINFEKNLKSKHGVNLFKIQKYDYFNEHTLKFNKKSLNYNQFDFLNLKHKNVFVFEKQTLFLKFLNSQTFPFFISLNDEFFNSNLTFNGSSHSFNFVEKIKSMLNKLPGTLNTSVVLNKILNNNLYNEQSSNTIGLKPLSKYFFNFNKFKILLSCPKLELSSFIVSKPFFFKYFSFKNDIINFDLINTFKFFSFFGSQIFSYLKSNTLYSRSTIVTNIIPAESFQYIFRKYVIKSFKYHKFPFATTPWHYNTLIKFLEYCSGKKIYINFSPFLNNILDYNELLRCEIWSQRLRSFKKALGPKLFLNESLQIIYISLKLKDPFFLSNWLLKFFYKISFWKYKLVFRYLQYVLRYFFWPVFSEIKLKGLKFQLKGKVSVAGNARTRTIVNKIGFLSHSTFDNKVLYDLNLIKTFTGVIGFKTWLVF